MDDASLDDFLDDGAGASDGDEAPVDGPEAAVSDEGRSVEGEPTDEPDEADAADDEATAESDAVDPATATMTFAPEGAECEVCGERATRRWTDDGALVCRACKEW